MAESKQSTALFMCQKDDKIENLISSCSNTKLRSISVPKTLMQTKLNFMRVFRQRLAAVYKEEL